MPFNISVSPSAAQHFQGTSLESGRAVSGETVATRPAELRGEAPPKTRVAQIARMEASQFRMEASQFMKDLHGGQTHKP